MALGPATMDCTVHWVTSLARLGLCWLLCSSFTLSLVFFPPFQANIGQKEDFEAARKKALALGAKKVTVSFLPGSWGV